MLTEKGRVYPLTALDSAPVVFEALLAKRGSDDKLWDFRPDANRFSLREAIAHIADWDPIFQGRLERIVNEDTPTLPDMDEGAIAIQNNYAAQDPIENIKRWKANRTKLIAYIKSLSNDQFLRTGHKPPLGEISINGWLALMIGHDIYHMRQVVDYISAYETGSSGEMGPSWDTTSKDSPFQK